MKNMNIKKNTKIKKFWFYVLIIGVAGLVLMGAGYAMGGSTDGFYFDRNGLQTGTGRNKESVEQKFSYISNIYIDTSEAKVNIETGEYGISVVNNRSPEIKYNIDNDGNLRITQTGISWFIFGIGIQRSNSVTVYLPQDAVLGIVDINSSSGNVSINRIDCENFTLKLSSGRSTVENIVSKNQINIRSLSGNISINNSRAEKIDLNVSSGRINMERLTASAINATSSSGNINVKQSEADNFDFQLSSGTLRANGIVSNGLNARLKSGNSHLEGVFLGENMITSTSGTVRMEISGSENDYSRNLSATSGTIRVNGDRNSGSITNAGASNSIGISARSGNIHVNFKR
jgi:DUF4097 and DUF4098 domain-containing protein YvlB